MANRAWETTDRPVGCKWVFFVIYFDYVLDFCDIAIVGDSQKKVAEATATAVVALTCRLEGVIRSSLSCLFPMRVVLVVCIDLSAICVVHAHMVKFQYRINTAHFIILIYYWTRATAINRNIHEQE